MAFPHVSNKLFPGFKSPIFYIKCFKKEIYFEHTDRAVGVCRKLEPVALVRQ